MDTLPNVIQHETEYQFTKQIIIGETALNLPEKKVLSKNTPKGFVTPKDFGAKGDGVTDDTKSVKKMVESGKDVYIDKGNYRLSDYIVVPYNQKVIIEDGVTGLEKYFIFINNFVDLSESHSKLVNELYMNGYGKRNALQSFVIDEESNEIYSTIHAGNNDILINKHTFSGRSLGDIILPGMGHGSLLALEKLPNGSAKLWTDCKPSSKGFGQELCRFSFDRPSELEYFKITPKGYKDPAGTIDNDNQLLIVRFKEIGTPNVRVNVYDLKEILEKKSKPAFSFYLHEEQLGTSFQGMHVRDNIVYVLTGDSSIEGKKRLYGYDFKGNVIFKKSVEAGKGLLKDVRGTTYEPEGVFVTKDQITGEKSVYVGMVMGKAYNAKTNPEGKIKLLFSYDVQERNEVPKNVVPKNEEKVDEPSLFSKFFSNLKRLFAGIL